MVMGRNCTGMGCVDVGACLPDAFVGGQAGQQTTSSKSWT